MQKFKNSAAVALTTLASLSLGACSILGTGGEEKRAHVSASTILRNVPEVENSPDAPCWQQRQIAAQRAYIDSAVKGKPKRYHADCADEPPAKPEPKTS